MTKSSFFSAICCAVIIAVSYAYCDIVELKDGTVMKDCFVKDEGIRLIVWESLEKVGTPDYKVIPRSQLAPEPMSGLIHGLLKAKLLFTSKQSLS